MAPTPPRIQFDRQFDAQTGQAVAVAEGIVRVTAPNPSPYTFTGTNSFIVGHQRLAVIDPGPEDEAHEAALTAAIGERQVTAILLTHTHRDHSALAKTLGRRLGAPLWFGGQHRLSRPLRRFEVNPIRRSCDWDLVPDRVLTDGALVELEDMVLRVHTTPGHCANHLAFGVADGDVLFSGDHVMGWSTTVVSPPDGDMTAYMASLEKLMGRGERVYYPGHGDIVDRPQRLVRGMLGHRKQREGQIIRLLTAEPMTIPAMVEKMYVGLDPRLIPAAERSVLAHLYDLRGRGLVAAGDDSEPGGEWRTIG